MIVLWSKGWQSESRVNQMSLLKFIEGKPKFPSGKSAKYQVFPGFSGHGRMQWRLPAKCRLRQDFENVKIR